MPHILAVVVALAASGCGVKAGKQEATGPLPKQEDRFHVRAMINGLTVEVVRIGSDIFRFDVKPLEGEGSESRLEVEAISLPSPSGQIWSCALKKIERFGRAEVPGLELWWEPWDGEALFGLGERFDSLNQAGKVVDMWIEDAPGQGDAGHHTYFATPVLYSTRGYAFFAADNPDAVFDLNSRGDGMNRYRRAGQAMTFYVAFGDSLKDLVRKRKSVQGPFKSIPDWAWGPWISRNSYEKQSEAEDAINGMIQRKLPVAAIVQEAWKGRSETGDFNNFSAERWPDLPRFFELCNRHGIKNVLWQVPIIHPSSPEFAMCKENGYFVKKPDGAISFRRHWLEGFANVDFTNPDAVKYWQDLIRPTVRLGIWGFKADDGEDIKPDDVFFDGRRGWEMHNEYSTLYNRALTELLEQEGVDGLLWARSGSLGIERYPALWAGDQFARWDQMASLIPAGLSSGMSGMPFWGHDIGGYIDQPSSELYIRWAQFGALSPLMQYHGVLPREPWFFGPQAEEAYKLLAYLRMNLVPTLIALGRETEETGFPIMRPMLMEFPDDARFVGEDTQYMLGPDLLVAPVIEEEAMGRRIEFPEGVWQHALYPVAYTGPASVEVPIGLVDAPLFVREGATLKLQLNDDARLGAWRPDDPIRDVQFEEGRAVIRNLRAPLAGNILNRSTVIVFDISDEAAAGLIVNWFMDDNAREQMPANVEVDALKVRADITPPPQMQLAGRLQTYVIVSRYGEELFRGSIRWKSPVAFDANRHRMPVIGGACQTYSTRLINSGESAVTVRVSVAAMAGARVEGGPQAVEVSARGDAELSWSVVFDEMKKVGDTRIRFTASSDETVFDQQIVTFVRMPRWIVVGPFPAPPRRAYGMEFEPERFAADPRIAFQTAEGEVSWRQVPSEHLGQFGGIDFNELFGYREHAAAYALTRIRAERETPVELRFGSDDTLTVWLNGKRIHSVETYRLAEPDQEIVKTTLRKGVNTLLVKVAQDKHPWKLLFRVTAPDGVPVIGLSEGFEDFGAYADGRSVSMR